MAGNDCPDLRCEDGNSKTDARPGSGRTLTGSTPQAQARHHLLVALGRGALQVVQELAPLVHHLEKAATRSMVALVGDEVLAELVDACGEQCDLHLRRARVFGVTSILRDDSAFLLCRQ